MNEETQQKVVEALKGMANGLDHIRASLDELDTALNPNTTPRLVGFTPNPERE